ncbi:MAG: GHKL domain-containing protein, partial [Coprobacillus sp.]
IALIMFDRYQRRAEQIEKDFLITKQNIELEKQYIKEVGERNELVRAFRHDFKNKVTIISGLIQKNLSAEAITELETILGETLDLTVETYVDNVYVDTAIDAKVKIIKRKGFEFNETYGLISIGNICAADLALAVALAMDNAIEAVENIKDAQQKISLDIRTNKNYIIMTLSNSIQPGTKVQFSHTSKTEQIENHGFGVKKIKSIADAYDGDAKYEVYDDHVTLKLFMSISKGIEKEKA